jgi:HlyD family secretion protein
MTARTAESPTSGAIARDEQVADQPGVATPVPPVAVATPASNRRAWYAIGAVILVVAVLAIAGAWSRFFAPPLPPVIMASGRIEGREVTLAPKSIQGRVKRLLVDEGDTVTEGQLLAQLDAAQIEAQAGAALGAVANLDAQIAQATLDVAYTAKNSAASIAAADAALATAQAHVTRAKAVVANSQAAHDRATTMFSIGAISKQDLDLAEMALRTSDADEAAAEKDVVGAEANLALARASADTIGLKRQQLRALQESRASAIGRLAEAQANLAERQIIAPVGGTIVSRPVEVGDVVSPGSPVFQMIDMNRLYVKVYIPEPDVARLRLGDPADVFVDAFPRRSFAARISKISDQAEFTPKNVETAEERLKLVFGVELALAATDGLLKPGMPVDAVIHWQATTTGEGRRGS